MTFKAFLRGTASVAGLLVLGSAAMAADLPSRKVEAAPPVMIDTFHPFQIRLRATAVIPDGKTTFYDKVGAILPALGSSAGPGGEIFAAGAKVSTTVIPELDVSYYFTKNIAVEAICCLSKHNVTGTGVLNGLPVGSTWVFPPTVLLQYHFTNFGAFQPYIGVGVNFTAYFGTKSGGGSAPFFTPALGLTGVNSVSNLSIGSSWGVAGQVGFDNVGVFKDSLFEGGAAGIDACHERARQFGPGKLRRYGAHTLSFLPIVPQAQRIELAALHRGIAQIRAIEACF